MKALIVILALVAVSFIGLLVYGESRGEQPKKSCEQVPNLNSKEGPKEDDLENWCPPSIAEATKGLQARFAPDLKLEQPATLRSSSSALQPASFAVLPSSTKMRSAHIELVEGNAAILTGKKAKLCLCRAGVPINSLLFDGDNCPDRWKSDHRENAKPGQQGVCQPDDVRGILPFDSEGGLIGIDSQPPATVRIK